MTTPPSGSRSRKRGNSAAKSAFVVETHRRRRRPDWCECAQRVGAAAEALAQDVEQKRLADRQAAPQRSGSARPHWRSQAFGAASLATLQHGIAHLREQVHVLMAVDEVGRAAEAVDEHAELAHDLVHQHVAVEAMQHGAQQRRPERQKGAVAQRRERFAERTERRGQA